MKSPTGPIRTYAQVASTQDIAKELLDAGEHVGAVLAMDQTEGRGRFQREWHSRPGESLTISWVMDQQADHPRPWLVGMAVALVAVGVIRCQIQWPNDLTIGPKKVGGILTEIHVTPDGRKIPIVGMGINLNQAAFPEEIAHRAISLKMARGHEVDAEALARAILARMPECPEPDSWDCLADVWNLFDHTAGKQYDLGDGETAVGIGVGPDGQLICSVAGETRSILAADAIFGENRIP